VIEKPDSIRGKRWTEEKKVKPYGRDTLFLQCAYLEANRKDAAFRHRAVEGK
jgi:hypothetical protein